MYSPCRNRCECKEAVCGQAASDAFTSRHSGCSLAWIAHACEPKKPDEVAIASLLNRLMVTLMAPYFLIGVWLPLMRNDQFLIWSELSLMRNRSFLIGV